MFGCWLQVRVCAWVGAVVRVVLSVALWCLCGGFARFCWVRVVVCASVALEVFFVDRLAWVSVSVRGAGSRRLCLSQKNVSFGSLTWGGRSFCELGFV